MRAALENGESVSWRFSTGQKRLALSLPAEFGGRTYEVCLEGGYTFTGVRASPAV